jgi:hypothetical protein
VKEFGFVPVESVEEAIEKALAIHGKNAKILCLPKGTHVAPVVSERGARERASDK